MKKILAILMTAMIFITTGCLKRDTMEDILIYTSAYPIKYITEELYGKNATIESIYPTGIVINKYNLTDKQLEDYSDCDLFIFNGLNTEKDYVTKFIKYPKNIKIIDATSSMEITNRVEELWLNPSNLLMIAQNIKSGFNEYITNHYIKEAIEANYDELKIEISNLDANISLIKQNANNTTIIVSDDLFLFLEKFGFNVVSLDSDTTTEKKINVAKQLLLNGECSYIFTPNNEEYTDIVKNLIKETHAEVKELHTLSNISEEERSNKKDYLSIMNENIEAIKNEVYN